MCEVDRLKSLLHKEFDMKDLGIAKKILGMEIHRYRESRKQWLSQKNYIRKVFEKFNMQDAKPVSTHWRITSNYLLVSARRMKKKLKTCQRFHMQV